MKKVFFVFVLFLSFTLNSFSEDNFVKVKLKPGEALLNIFSRYELSESKPNKKKFKELNDVKNIEKVLSNKTYLLPIKIYKYNGKSVSSSLKIEKDIAKQVHDYNRSMQKKGLKEDYKKDKEIWYPLYDITETDLTSDDEEESKPIVKETPKSSRSKKEVEKSDDDDNLKSTKYSIFGPEYSKVKQLDNKLSGAVIFLDPGHGGIDPGAVGYKDNHELHEHEYAYDVTLRLARIILQHGGKVYVLVQDPDDGIRDDKYLNNSTNGVFLDGTKITGNQNQRLKRRAEIINSISNKLKKKNPCQRTVVIHVDSRSTNQRVDMFFYYRPGNEKSKKFAESMLNTVEERYSTAQPGRGYTGSVSERNLYMLKCTNPTAVYIELGNIQNPRNQIRLIEANNRQAIANWLCDGIIKDVKNEINTSKEVAKPKKKKSK